MNVDHDALVAFAKSFGLLYMMAMFAAAVVYACWPSNQSKFDRAANSVLEEDKD